MAADLLNAETGLAALRAIAEPTRLRVLALLVHGELTVKDLTTILRQSQPRISRHLKLMYDAGLITRVQEGSWVHVRLSDAAVVSGLVRALLARFDMTDQVFRRDRQRADEIRDERSRRAQDFFACHADEWDRLRAMHADEQLVESKLCALLEGAGDDLVVDMGTGTGRILELLAPKYRRAIGIDSSPEMLAYARARIQDREFAHVQARQGDICDVAFPDASVDTVIMHQVLHYIEEPAAAISEAARILVPGGRLLIVDFAAHNAERLRDEFAHRRLGFTGAQIETWCENSGLVLDAHEMLPPGSANCGAGTEERLTVSFWLAIADGAGAPEDGRQTLEIAQ